MLRGVFILIIIAFLILSLIPLFQMASNQHERNDLRIGAARLEGDVNHDGTVNIFDYNIVVSNFGKTK